MAKLKTILLSTTLIVTSEALAEAPYKLNIAGFAGNNRNFVQSGAFLPIISSEEGLFFADIRAMKHVPHSKKKHKRIYSDDTYEFNFGLGYRHVINSDLVFGGVAYYDIRKAELKNTHLGQTTLNTHILSPTWQSNLNLYIPVGKSKISKTTNAATNQAKIINNDVYFRYKNQTITEHALKGVDFRISTVIPGLDSLRLGPVAYHFKGNKSMTGGGLEMKWAYNDSLDFESSITYDKIRKTNFIAGIRFTFASPQTNARSIDKLLSTRVERDIDLIANKRINNNDSYVQDPNFVVIKSNELNSINSSNLSTQDQSRNAQIVKKLLSVAANNGTVIVTDNNNDGDITVTDDIKIDINSLSQSIAASRSDTKIKLDKQTSEDDLRKNAVKSTKTTRENLVSLIATEQAIQDSNLQNKLLNDPNFRSQLIDQFSKLGSGQNASYYINLPGHGNVEVKRAGTVLVLNQNGQQYAVIGVDENNAMHHAATGNIPYSTWFTGSLDSSDGSVYQGLMRETFEESAGMLLVSQTEFDYAILNGHFMYDPRDKTLAIVKYDSANKHNINNLNNELASVKGKANISHSFKEMRHYHLVSVNELNTMNTAIGKNTHTNSHDATYRVNTVSGITNRILKQYADSFHRGGGMQAINKAIGK